MLAHLGRPFVHPEGLEPPTTDPKSVMISTSPRVQCLAVYYSLVQNSIGEIEMLHYRLGHNPAISLIEIFFRMEHRANLGK